jgi:hypothetical protein
VEYTGRPIPTAQLQQHEVRIKKRELNHYPYNDGSTLLKRKAKIMYILSFITLNKATKQFNMKISCLIADKNVLVTDDAQLT